ncbi:MAG: alpha-galactosidase [Micropepsaceae bacterium]
MTTDRFQYLRNAGVSLLIDARPDQEAIPRILHFGADLGPSPDFDMIEGASPIVVWGARMDKVRPVSVLPGIEAGYFGTPAMVTRSGQKWRTDNVSAKDNSVQIRLGSSDDRLTLTYRLTGQGVLATRVSAEFSDPTSRPRWLAATSLPLGTDVEELLVVGGDWAREFAIQRHAIGAHAVVIESRRGRAGHDRFPGLFAGTKGFNDDHGEVYGLSVGWSGSHRMVVERLREGTVVIQAGELFSETDSAPANYETPWCYTTYSPLGLNGAMQALHSFVREEILPRSIRSKPRPVHYNTWEAVYFKHDLATLCALADRAAAVGAERFVLDDGWFKGRSHDRAALGDWIVDPTKYPDGLTPLIRHVRSLGLEFGLWVEPEMINPDSELARLHPDWIRRDGDELLLQRHQAVLDMERPEVRTYLYDALHKLLSENDISYLKWDMNRDVTGGSHHEYVRSVWNLIDRLRAGHPLVEIETCASGGGRCDYGMLERTERVWVSDSNDALDRFDIQRNANLFLPPEIAGVHVGPSTCHITGRKLGLDLRAHVAMFGHMGLELDLRQLDERELQRLSQHIQNHKSFRHLVHSGCYWRIEPTGTDHCGIGVSASNKSEGLYLVVRTGSEQLGRGTLVKFPGLEMEQIHAVSAVAPIAGHVEQSLGPALRMGNLRLSGRVLAHRGLELNLPRPESSLLLHVKAV